MLRSAEEAILALPLAPSDSEGADKGELGEAGEQSWLSGKTMAYLSPVIEYAAEGALRVILPVPMLGCVALWQQRLRASGVTQTVEWGVRVEPSCERPHESALPGVRNIIAVASGKGGVGKSTTAVNLAAALQAEGANVGVLDADIHGPSQPTMWGLADRGQPDVTSDNRLIPFRIHDVQVMSMGFLVTPKTPTVWRGPMVSGAFRQLLQQTAWQDVDYLIVDMPPGTGDIQLTLSQHVPVDGSVIVTTPQDIACLDARKGIEMFRKVRVPVLGLVENMAMFHCPNCGAAASIFGTEGGHRLASEYEVPLLARLPLMQEIREQTDAGTLPVFRDPDGAISTLYRCLAREVAVALRESGDQASHGVPEIEICDD
ncbi:MAG: iron-sulfur cluster carrier protein ApbC [Gammaproteobacteria bacterium]